MRMRGMRGVPGPGDPATWPDKTDHPNDPRNDRCDTCTDEGLGHCDPYYHTDPEPDYPTIIAERRGEW